MNQVINIQYKKSGYIEKLYKIQQRTLYNYSEKGIIRYIVKNNTNIRYYNIRDVMKLIDKKFISSVDEKEICYTRISKKEDLKILEEQINYFKINFPLYEIIYDISDDIGANFLNIINDIKDKKVSILVLYNEQVIPNETLKPFLILIRLYHTNYFICNKTSST